MVVIKFASRAKPQLNTTLQNRMTFKHTVGTHYIPQSGVAEEVEKRAERAGSERGVFPRSEQSLRRATCFAIERVVAPQNTGFKGGHPKVASLLVFFFCSMTPGQVLFDQAGLGRGKVGGRGIGKSAAVRGLERGTSFGEVRAPYLQATPAASIIPAAIFVCSRPSEYSMLTTGTST